MACDRCKKMFQENQALSPAQPIVPIERINTRETLHVIQNNIANPNYQGIITGVYRDKDGFDRDGYDKEGFSRAGFDREGYDRGGFNKHGFNRPGWNTIGLDRDGYRMTGVKEKGVNKDGYMLIGYRFEKPNVDTDGFDISGYDENGFDRAGYDKVGVHKSGLKHAFFSADAAVFYGDGFDRHGFGRDGYNRDGRDRYGFDRTGYNEFEIDRMGKAKSPSNKPPITPLTAMTRNDYLKTLPPGKPDKYDALTGADLSTEQTDANLLVRYKTSEFGRLSTDPKAVLNGVLLRCWHCGQFTGGKEHSCPGLPVSKGQLVKVYVNGSAQGKVDGAPIWYFTPYNPDYDPRYNMKPGFGYLYGNGTDREGYDAHGYKNGYNRKGFDREGFGKDGFDTMGYNRNGQHKDGHRRPNPLSAVQDYLEDGTTLLDNKGLVDVYSRLATSLARSPRQVVLRPGEGFSTDLRGTMVADPIPLGPDAPDRHNLVCTKAGIGHELGHEVFTPQDIFARIIQVATSKDPIEGLDKGRGIVKTIFNVVEDGRIERAVGNRYPGIADALLAQCALMPRWDEKVGESVGGSHEIIGAMLYTGLPCFSVKDDVRALMTTKGQDLLKEFEPIINAAVRGTPEDVYNASIYISRRMEQEGLLDVPDNFVDDTPSDPNVKPRILKGKPPKGAPQPQEGGGGKGEQVFYEEAPDPEDNPQEQAQGGGKRPKGQEYVDGYAAEGNGGGGGSQEDKSNVDYIPKNAPRLPEYKGDKKNQQGQNGQRGSSGQEDDQQGQQGQGGGAGGKQDDKQSQQGQGGGAGGQEDDKQGQQGQGGGAGGQEDDKQGQQGQGGGAGGQEDDQQGQQGQGGGAGGKQDDKQGQQGSGGQQDGQQGQSSSTSKGGSTNSHGATGGSMDNSGSISGDMSDDVFANYGKVEVGQILDNAEESATAAIIGDARRRARPEVLGKRLQDQMTDQDESTQIYRSLTGLPEKVKVAQPKETNNSTVAALINRREAHKKVASDMARVLKAIREQKEALLRNQRTGRLDSHRLVNAMLDSDTVKMRTDESVPKTSIAVSTMVDMSGSMGNHISSGALFDAAMTLSDTFEELDAPNEFRAFGSSDVQVKAMKDKEFAPERAAFLATGSLGGTELHRTAGLAITALGGCQEYNKMAIVLSDGMLSSSDMETTCQTFAEARKSGVVTYGIFLEGYDRADPSQMNKIYGVGNWASIRSLEDMPKLVAGRIAQIFKSLR